MDIHIITIPHELQRYPTCGDFFTKQDGSIEIRISDTGNEDYALLIAIHELIELWLTKQRGISEDDITLFDVAHSNSDEPGAEPDSPYLREHFFAECIERIVAGELEINWQEYEKALSKL